MYDVLMAVAVFAGIAALFKIVADGILRAKVINKGLLDEKVKFLSLGQSRPHPLSNLKWGMVLVGIGVALLFKQIAPFWVSDETVFGIMFIFAGAAFLVYYGIAKNRINDEDTK